MSESRVDVVDVVDGADVMDVVEGVRKARLIVLDIETYRTRSQAVMDRIRDEAWEKRPAQNTLKELKLEWDTFEAREKRAKEALDKTAVDVLLAEVLCVCWILDGEWFRYWADEKLSEPEMLENLAKVWDWAAGQDTIWCGHNLMGFDLAVLLNRWRHFGIRPPEHFPVYVNGRWRGRVFDTMARTPCKNGLGFVGLEEVCAAYGVELKTQEWNGAPLDGSRVGEAYEAGAILAIVEYCMADVEAVSAVYSRMTDGDTWGTYETRDEIGERIVEIEGDDHLSQAGKALAIVQVLDRAGLVPRA